MKLSSCSTPLAGFALVLLCACGGTTPARSEGGPEGFESASGGERAAAGTMTAAETPAPIDGDPADAGTETTGIATDLRPETTGETPAGEVVAPVDPALEWRQRVGRGLSVFRQSCDTCHPGGEADLGPTLRGLRMSVDRMTRQIRRGSGRMRPIPPGRLPDRYLGDLMAYLSTLRAVHGVPRP